MGSGCGFGRNGDGVGWVNAGGIGPGLFVPGVPFLFEHAGKTLEGLVGSAIQLIQGIVGDRAGLCGRFCLGSVPGLLRDGFKGLVGC